MVLLTLSIQIQNESDQIHETLDKNNIHIHNGRQSIKYDAYIIYICS